MSNDEKRIEILVNGLVQGVGFRYYVLKNAQKLGVTGFVKNLYTGEVLTVAEGDKASLEELFKLVKTGPMHASVNKFKVDWLEPKNEFKTFEIKH